MTGQAAAADDIAIRLEDLTKSYAGSPRPAVGDLNLAIPRGELVALVGPSGCGKTTTLKMINRLVEPTAGTVWLEGTDIRTLPVHELRRGIGYVIQQAGLFPHRKVRDNIATVPQLLGWPKHRIAARVDELAALLDLDPALLGRYPAGLSGGQQQRVGVARALAADPPVLLMDEPYSAVDPIVRARLQDELLALQRRVNKTIVLVTHDIDEAIKLADRIAILNVGGVLEQVGPPEELLRAPANDFVADFLGDDRGIKRLSLMRVGQTRLSRGPVVAPTDTAGRARAVMASEGTDWVAVVDDGRLLGWVAGDALDGDGSPMADLHPRPFRAVVHPNTTLKGALDVIVTSQTRVAVVVDGGGAEDAADESLPVDDGGGGVNAGVEDAAGESPPRDGAGRGVGDAGDEWRPRDGDGEDASDSRGVEAAGGESPPRDGDGEDAGDGGGSVNGDVGDAEDAVAGPAPSDGVGNGSANGGVGAGGYLGMLTVDDLAEGITQ